MTTDPGRLPDFVVVGAMKAGTTSLLQNLLRHRQVRMPPLEVHFFDKHFDKGIPWYRQHFVRGTGKRCGEKTPSYMTRRTYMKRMHHVIPNAQIVALLREPVARLISQINHRIQKGRLPAPASIDTAWLREHILATSGAERDYVGRGRYAELIEQNILPFYPRERVFIRATDEFRRSIPMSSLERVVDGTEDKARGTERSEGTRRLMHDLQDFLGIERRDPVAYRVVGVRNYIAEVDPDARAFLHSLYEEDNERLFELLGYRIETWDRAIAVGN